MNLNKGQLILLKYIHNTLANDRLPNYFLHTYKLNTDECIKQFWDNDLIEYADIDVCANHCTIQQIKEILSEHSLSTSGNKTALIERLISNIDEAVLKNIFEKYIVVTNKGQALLENLSDFEWNNRYDLCYLIPDFEIMMKSIMENNFININTNIPFSEMYAKHKIEACKTFYKDNNSLSNEVKAIIILKFLDDSRIETAQKSIIYYLNENIKFSVVAHSMNWIKSYSEIINLKQSKIPLTYTVRTMKDGAVCEHCKSLENKMFDMKDAIIGVNYPPFNDCKSEFCRCYASHDIDI